MDQWKVSKIASKIVRKFKHLLLLKEWVYKTQIQELICGENYRYTMSKIIKFYADLKSAPNNNNWNFKQIKNALLLNIIKKQTFKNAAHFKRVFWCFLM